MSERDGYDFDQIKSIAKVEVRAVVRPLARCGSLTAGRYAARGGAACRWLRLIRADCRWGMTCSLFGGAPGSEPRGTTRILSFATVLCALRSAVLLLGKLILYYRDMFDTTQRVGFPGYGRRQACSGRLFGHNPFSVTCAWQAQSRL